MSYICRQSIITTITALLQIVEIKLKQCLYYQLLMRCSKAQFRDVVGGISEMESIIGFVCMTSIRV
jgi:hypothetical protein